MNAYKTEFLELALELGVLKFGEFTLKSGRVSPYFFNAGLFNSGYAAAKLGRCYASAIAALDIEFDMLFGPAYKGITLAAAVAIELARVGCNVPFAYNRKEAKDHGEGGALVGAPLTGRVVVIDDVISAGTSVRESVGWIRAAGAEPVAVAIALDRQERAAEGGVDKPLSAVQYVIAEMGMQVVSVATLTDLLEYLSSARGSALAAHAASVAAYRERYGV